MPGFRIVFVLLAAAAAWSVAIGGHELIGHGGVCAVDPACTWRYADGMYFDGRLDAGAWQSALIAGGSIFNILLGLACAVLLTVAPRLPVALRLLFWALMTACLIQSGSYIAFGPMIHDGMDWARLQAMELWPPAAQMAAGLALIAIGIWLARHFLPAVDGVGVGGVGLVVTALAGFSLTSLATGLIVPSDDRMMMIWGGIGNGTGFMSWMLLALVPGRARPAPAQDLTLRSLAWLGVFAVFIAGYLAVLGPGISFHSH